MKNKNKIKFVELIAFDKNHNLEFQGRCKLVLNVLSKMLIVEPKNEEFKMKSAIFNWKFVIKRNILFVFAEHNFMDFALIFGIEEVAKKIYDLIQKQKDQNVETVTDEMVVERFLIPIFNKINNENFTTAKKLIYDWFLSHDQTDREKYLRLLKECSGEGNDDVIIQMDTVNQEICNKNSRKRRHFETTKSSDNKRRSKIPSKKKTVLKNDCLEYSKTIPSSQFKLVTVKVKCGIQRRLIIFSSSSSDDIKKCYEYTCKNQKYFCRGCAKFHKRITAIIEYDKETEEDCVKLINKSHCCSPIPYQPEQYSDIIILKKLEYKFFDTCTTQSGKVLFIFHPTDPNLCYQYSWKSLECKFYCRGCQLKKKDTTAEICNENQRNEYIQLLHTDHVCEYIEYQPEKFNQFKDIVIKPDFEIQTKIKNGRKTLIIFHKNDKSLCYIYFFNNQKNDFLCAHCHEKGKTVSAKLCQNSEGEEYIILSNAQHCCNLRKYIPQINEIILRPPNIKIVTNEKGQMILYVFTSDDQSQCYIFVPVRKNDKRYLCRSCKTIFNSKSIKHKNVKEGGKIVYAYLSKEDNSEADDYCIRMPPGQKHMCKPHKYIEPEQPSPITIQPNDYVLFRQKLKTKEVLYVGIYLKDNRKLCYKYWYDGKCKQFVCNACGCHKNRIRTSAKLEQDSEGNEFIIANGMKHNCSPIKVSTIKEMKEITILEKTGLTLSEPKKKKVTLDENKILRHPNFELQRSVTGVTNGKLIVFKGGDRNLCYNYFLNKTENFYACAKCLHMKNRVRANLFIDEENGEKYIELGVKEHVCEAVKYEPEKDLIDNSNFMVFNSENEKKLTKLIIFTSPSKELCFEFLWRKDKQIFMCLTCEQLKTTVSAKIIKADDDQEFVQLFRNDHICQPKKFKLEEYQRQTISKSRFFLCPNLLRKTDAKLVLFDEKREGFCYEYHSKGERNLYICTKCCSQSKKYISAKLSKDGESLELSPIPHICDPIKYDPTKYEKNEIVTSDRFVLGYTLSGKASSKLTIFDSNDKNLGYEYYFSSAHDIFYCYECSQSKLRKNIAAKLLTDENGKKSIEIKKQKHVCKIQNLKEMKKIVESDEFKFDEDQKEIIVNHPTDKKSCYKFIFDEEINAFRCIQCKSKDKCLTATFCKDKNEKEFLFLNDFHRCIPLKK